MTDPQTVLPGQPRDETGPVFREPWEAQAFAMTLALHERGLFTWPQWAATLAEEIKRAQAAGDPDTGETYYRHWLNALERLVAENGVTDAAALALHERGLFTWSEWAATLSDEIKRAQAAGDPDTGDTYYRHWLAALERLVAEKGVTDRASLARYRDAWHRAADRTPHGMPIALREEDFAG